MLFIISILSSTIIYLFKIKNTFKKITKKLEIKIKMYI